MHVNVKELDPTLQKALQALNYNRKDISVEPRTTYSMTGFSGDGYQGFTCAVNLATGQFQIEVGSWGGANPWNKNAVDLDSTERPIPSQCAIIQGVRGGGKPVYASIRCNANDLKGFLPPAEETTEREKAILETFGYISSYKKDLQRNLKVTQEELNSLRDKGFITINKAGGTSLTAKGRNARG